MKRRSKSARLAHLQAWRSSGLSKVVYCQDNGIKYATFMSWFKLEDSAVDTGQGHFLKIERPSFAKPLIIELPNGVRLHWQGDLNADLLQLLSDA